MEFYSLYLNRSGNCIHSLQRDTLFSSLLRRSETEHLNLGSSAKHFLSASRKQLSDGILVVISDMTKPNENMSEAIDGGWPRTISGAMWRYFLL